MILMVPRKMREELKLRSAEDSGDEDDEGEESEKSEDKDTDDGEESSGWRARNATTSSSTAGNHWLRASTHEQGHARVMQDAHSGDDFSFEVSHKSFTR